MGFSRCCLCVPLMKYSSGNASNLGLVRTLPHTTFDDLVKAEFGNPVTLPLSKADYRSLSPAKQAIAKRTRFVTPGLFSSETRRTEFVDHANLIFIDIDVEYEDKAKTIVKAIPAKGILDRLEDMPNILAPFNHAIYRTASSTPELPRLRVVVDAEKIPPALYPAAVRLIGDLLSLTNVTSESSVVAQPMFLPVQFRGELEHPLLATRFDARALTVDDVGESPAPANPTLDVLDTLRPALEEVSAADVESALSSIDPDCDRVEWIQIGAGLKHQFGEGGLDLWRTWSSAGTKFAGEAQLMIDWRSLHHTPTGRAPVTIRTVLKMAKAAGWSSETVVQRCFQTVSDWIMDEARTEVELMQTGVTRIAGTPLLSTVEKGVLLNKLSRALRSKDAPITRSDLMRGFRRAEKELRGKGGDHEGVNGPQLPDWAKGITYVAQTNEFYRQGSGQKWGVDALNNNFSQHLIAEDAENARPSILPQHYLLNQIKIPRVDHYQYDPTQPNEAVVEMDNRRYINTYRSTFPGGESTKEAADAIGKLVTEHTHKLFGDTPEARHLLDWMSYIVQNQGARVLWAPTVQGAEGCGKTLYAVIMRLVLGSENVKEVQPNVVANSDWNEWSSDCQLVVLEEVRVVGESRFAVMNKLKPLITNQHISINQRNRDTRVVCNFANYFLTSNFADALAITENDRRYYVLFAKQQTKESVRDMGVKYFKDLYAEIHGGAQALRTWLMEREIHESFDPLHCPATADKASMTQAASSPLHRAVSEVIEDGDNPLVKPDLVSIKLLRQLIETESRGLGRFSDSALASILRDMGFVSAGRIRFDGSRQSFWSKDLDHTNIDKIIQIRSDPNSDLL